MWIRMSNQSGRTRCRVNPPRGVYTTASVLGTAWRTLSTWCPLLPLLIIHITWILWLKCRMGLQQVEPHHLPGRWTAMWHLQRKTRSTWDWLKPGAARERAPEKGRGVGGWGLGVSDRWSEWVKHHILYVLGLSDCFNNCILILTIYSL